MSRPTLKVLQGSWQANSKWLNFPATVAARSPFDKDEPCRFRIGREDAIKEARAHKRQPVFNLWSAVLGQPPRVPLVQRKNPEPFTGLTRLDQAHACFKGLKRPCDDDPSGQHILAYVLKPTYMYVYDADPVCVAKKVAVPDDLVFVAYARLDIPCKPYGHLIKGVLTHWQFVETDKANETLPVDYESRYDRRLW